MARIIAIGALAVHLFSLFLPYQQAISGTRMNMVPPFRLEPDVMGQLMQTGFQLKPFAVYVLIGLLIAFLSSFHRNPLWTRWGYLLTIVLVVVFAIGGAPFQTSGGNLSLVSFAMLCLAAVINWMGGRKQADAPATP